MARWILSGVLLGPGTKRKLRPGMRRSCACAGDRCSESGQKASKVIWPVRELCSQTILDRDALWHGSIGAGIYLVDTRDV
jgi:hypothetical protein